MKNRILLTVTSFSLCFFLASCQPQESGDDVSQSDAMGNANAAAVEGLIALPGLENSVPALTEKRVISFQTTGGEILIEVYPQAAPNAVERFVELTESGYFDNTPVSRVVSGFVAQFGVNWREPHNAYQNNLFDDDPSLFALERGTLAFAKAGPNTNSTQVFINYQENNRLASAEYNFTTFGKIVQGMEIVDNFVQVGDPNGGLDQGRLWNDGEAYLEELSVKPSMIVTASVVE